MNAIKGEANIVNRRRNWASPLDASLFANSIGRPTFDAMQTAVHDSLPDFRRWMKVKAGLHGTPDALQWADLVAPLPVAPAELSWNDGLDIVRDAFGEFSPQLGSLVDRAIDERWIDADPREGKTGGAFCMPVSERPLARAAQLVRKRRLDPDHGARTGPRLPQHHARRTHGAAAQPADGAGRDGEHLLRDAGGRASRSPASTAPNVCHARRRPGRRQPGGRRHPHPLPVRDRGLRPPPAARARRHRARRADARRPGRRYGDGLDQSRPIRRCGR